MKDSTKETQSAGLLALVKARSSVRSFKPDKVERAKLEYILEVARLAPSAVNFQPWCFVVVREPERLKALYECYPRDWFAKAPVCIVVCGDHGASWKRASDNKDFCDVDVAIATEHLVLADVGHNDGVSHGLTVLGVKKLSGYPSRGSLWCFCRWAIRPMAPRPSERENRLTM